MEWRTDEPPKDGRIVAAVEKWNYGWYRDWEDIQFVAEVVWYNPEKTWALDNETSERCPTPVKFTKWMPWLEYPQC